MTKYQQIRNKDDRSKNIRLVHKKQCYFFVIFAVFLSFLYAFRYYCNNFKNTCPALNIDDRFDCHPEPDGNEENCLLRGCCWNPVTVSGKSVPACFYANNYGGYKLINLSDSIHQTNAVFERQFPSPYAKNDVRLVGLKAIKYKDTLRVKMFDMENKRYEPFIPQVPVINRSIKDSNITLDYEFLVGSSGFKIIRKTTNKVIFDCDNVGGFIYSDQFLQLSAIISSSFVYGLGEHGSDLLLEMNWSKFTMFNLDQEPIDTGNLYGSHPFYLSMEEDGNAYGVLLLNSDPMEIVLQPKPAITYRILGGVFDFYFFLGPKPSDVIGQYTEIVGRTFLPPFWSLGFHLSRFGYGSLNKTREVWLRTRQAGIPFDVQWNDIDYMNEYKDFTINENFANISDFVDELHTLNMHFIPIIDPGIPISDRNDSYEPFSLGQSMDIFIKNSSGDLFIGSVWNRHRTVWPDFTNPNTISYWTKLLDTFHGNVSFDGIWLDLNEPSNFINGSIYGCDMTLAIENPPYVPPVLGNSLTYKSLCMSAKQYAGNHYDCHNLYGFSEAIVTNFALKTILQKRPFIIGRSTFPGFGFFAGHWTGDVSSTWNDLRKSVSQILNFNMFGIPMVGADICGFNGNTTIELCQRWFQLGAFYPFMRNHNVDDAREQDPVALGPDVVASTKKYLLIRYSLLSYLYTLFWQASINGSVLVARPLFFEFPSDRNTWALNEQFLWGKGLMIIPVLYQKRKYAIAYIPNGYWYDFESKTILKSSGKLYKFSVPLDSLKLLYRGGSIIPKQKPEATTIETRQNSFELGVFLDSTNTASGELFWDDGESLSSINNREYIFIEFQYYANNTIRNNIVYRNFNYIPELSSLHVYGLDREVKEVLLNQTKVNFTFDLKEKALKTSMSSFSIRSKYF